MSVEVGPGTRLLCIEATTANPHMHDTYVGTVYTCSRVARPEECVSGCPIHADCRAGAVSLQEFGEQTFIHREPFSIFSFPYIPMYCLACFTPLGGDLPEEITRCLEVNPVDVKAPERAPARVRVGGVDYPLYPDYAPNFGRSTWRAGWRDHLPKEIK